MPDVLILARDTDDCLRIQELAQRFGYRVKTTSDTAIAHEWVSLKPFEVALIDSGIQERDQQRLSDAVWSRSPLATVVFFSLNESASFPGAQRLMGAEVAYGLQAMSQIEEIFNMVSARAKNEHAPGASQFQILVVEDLDAPRDIICSYIESMGFPSVSSVSSAEKALSLCESEPERFSCVVTDIRMPNIDGRELIETMRKHSKLQRIPILVLTAYGTADCLIDCLKAGASGFLVKPPKKADLRRELARAQRIAEGHSSPRLATPKEAEQLREVIESRLGT